VHVHAIGPGLVIPLLRVMGKKVVFTHHGPDYDRTPQDKYMVSSQLSPYQYSPQPQATSHSQCPPQQPDSNIEFKYSTPRKYNKTLRKFDSISVLNFSIFKTEVQ